MTHPNPHMVQCYYFLKLCSKLSRSTQRAYDLNSKSGTVQRVFFGGVQFSELSLDFRKSLIFVICRCRIIRSTNSNKTKFSRKANVQIFSTSTQCPQMVCFRKFRKIPLFTTVHVLSDSSALSTLTSETFHNLESPNVFFIKFHLTSHRLSDALSPSSYFIAIFL